MITNFFRQRHKTYYGEGYTFSLHGPFEAEYVDEYGKTRIVTDRRNTDCVFYDSYFPDLPERPKALLVERVTKALEAWGYTVVVKPFTDPEE